jgi:hypothetical protein
MTGDPRDFGSLEQRLGERLRQLPVVRAPHRLLPNVMAATAATRALPWYARPWLTWPVALQVVSIVIVAATATAAWSVWSDARAIGAVQQARQATSAVRVLWDVLIGPVAMLVLALTVIVSLACAAAWTAVRHVALGGASHR